MRKKIAKAFSKELKNESYLLSMIFLFSLFLSALFYQLMPDKMATHFNTSSIPDSFMPKQIALFLMPLLILVFIAVFYILPKADPLKANIEKFRKHYELLFILLSFFLLYMHAIIILFNLGISINISFFIVPAILVLLYFIGSVIQNTEQNWFIGIRTPWTLSSRQDWKKTNNLGGKLFKAFSALFLILFFIIPIKLFYGLLLFGLIAIIVFLFFYSYFLFDKSLKKKI